MRLLLANLLAWLTGVMILLLTFLFAWVQNH
jgi:hypothetical protein